MISKFLFITAILFSTVSFSHEGHDQLPGALKSNHGGVVQAGKEINLEYVVSGNEVKLYPLSHEGKDIPLKDVSFSVTSKRPKEKSSAIKVDEVDRVSILKVDFKKAYRIEVEVKVDHIGRESHFKFQVER